MMSLFKKKRIYLDHASTTQADSRVLAATEPYVRGEFGNPGSLHREGRAAKKALESAREKVAGIVHVHPSEIIFTASATEANNLAILGAVEMWKSMFKSPPHIVTTAFEHHSVLVPIKKLERWGARVTYISPNEQGLINPADIKNALTDDTVFVSVMYANNEIGTLQPITEIAKVLRMWRKEHQSKTPYPLFHSDMAQAPGLLPIDLQKLGVDLASFTSQKMYAPKGNGFLFKRREVLLAPQILGGTQEKRMRAGTENVPGIVGMAEALAIAEKMREGEVARLAELRDYFFGKLLEIPSVIANGDRQLRLANNINVSFLEMSGEQMVIELDVHGVAAATGSACTSDELAPSHVIMSLEEKVEGGRLKIEERARGAVRFSLGRSTTKKDIKYTLECIEEIIKKQTRN